MVVVGRPSYRIDCRTIKGGSQVSSLIVSFVESSNHCILGIIIFLGSWLVFLFEVSWAYGQLHDKLKFIENGVHMHLLWCFRCWSFCRFFIDRGFTSLYHWHFYTASSYYNQSLLDSSCRPESNKLVFAQFGAHMRRLWQFWFYCFHLVAWVLCYSPEGGSTAQASGITTGGSGSTAPVSCSTAVPSTWCMRLR